MTWMYTCIHTTSCEHVQIVLGLTVHSSQWIVHSGYSCTQSGILTVHSS